MASSKRKLDEKHLKMLRELVSLAHNKHCFDCNQRGPTYINMTIGSYICTQCSGLLRGLNPPHRVKSISMMSFTADEMDFLKARGNDLCRKVWLGIRNDAQSLNDSKDIEKLKSDMSIRYEKRRYYIEPSPDMFEHAKTQNLTDSDRITTSKSGSAASKLRPLTYVQKTPGNVSKVPPPVQIPVSNAPKNISFDSPTHKAVPAIPADNRSVDLLSDLGVDLFKQPVSTSTLFQTYPQPAKLAAEPELFSLTSRPSSMTPYQPAAAMNPQPSTLNLAPAQPVTTESIDDKYAALMNLNGDSAIEKQNSWSSSFNSANQGVFGATTSSNINGVAGNNQNPFISSVEQKSSFSTFPTSNSFPVSNNPSLFQSAQTNIPFTNTASFPVQNNQLFNPFPNSTLQQNPFPNSTSQQNTFTNTTSQQNSFPNSVNQQNIFPTSMPQQNMFPGQASQNNAFSNSASIQNLFPNSTQQNLFPNSNAMQQNTFSQIPTQQNVFSMANNPAGQTSFGNGYNMFPISQSAGFLPAQNSVTSVAPTIINTSATTENNASSNPPTFKADFSNNLTAQSSAMHFQPTTSTDKVFDGFSQPPPTYQQSFPTQNSQINSFSTNFPSSNSDSQAFTTTSEKTLPTMPTTNKQLSFDAFSQLSLNPENNPNPFMNVAKQNTADQPKGNPLNPFL